MSPEDQLAVEKQNADYEQEQNKLASAYYYIFKSEAGQIALKDLRERCNVNNSCIYEGNVKRPDPYAVMFQEGKRAVYNHIMMYIRHEIDHQKLAGKVQ